MQGRLRTGLPLDTMRPRGKHPTYHDGQRACPPLPSRATTLNATTSYGPETTSPLSDQTINVRRCEEMVLERNCGSDDGTDDGFAVARGGDTLFFYYSLFNSGDVGPITRIREATASLEDFISPCIPFWTGKGEERDALRDTAHAMRANGRPAGVACGVACWTRVPEETASRSWSGLSTCTGTGRVQ